MKWQCCALAGLLMGALELHSADTLTLKTERAPSPNGPWTTIQPSQGLQDGNGNPVVTAGQPEEIFRTRIERRAGDPAFDPVAISQIPSNLVQLAEDHLAQFTSPLGTNGLPIDPELWYGVKLAPQARPVYELNVANGLSPAYWEFQLFPTNPGPPAPQGRFVPGQPVRTNSQSGYILVSATEADSPIAEFATQGSSPLERLAQGAGTPAFKAIRFSSTFYTAEDGAGNVLASLGSQPFKPTIATADIPTQTFTFTGDDQTGLSNRTTFSGRITATGYQNYQEFRQDYVRNPLYQYFLKQRQARARTRWSMLRGVTEFPQVVVHVGQTINYTNRNAVRSAKLVSEDPIARVSTDLRTPNLVLITGVEVGTGTILLTDTTGTSSLTLSVVSSLRPAGDIFIPGWRTKKIYYAGTWDMQPKFYQLQRDEFCDYVGCGPVAWGMLLAWFEVNRQIPGAFGSPTAWDAGLTMNEYNKTYIDTWRLLHTLCGTWCVPFSDAGATWPWDMDDGALGYLLVPRTMGMINVNWASQWNFWSTGSYGMNCRDAIKKGYPAVVGLGWLWHYALAYGVAYQQFEGSPGVYLMDRRILKCNMGWGPDQPPQWYDLDDTFYGCDFHIYLGPLAGNYPPLK